MKRIAGVVVLAIVAAGAWALGAHSSSSSSPDTTPAASHQATSTQPKPTSTTAPAANDEGFKLLANGFQAEKATTEPIALMSASDQASLRHQLDLTLKVIEMYPTVKQAEAAGYRRAGPYSPGLGAHWVRANGASLNAAGVMTDDALMNPLALIYDGTAQDSPIAGLMYYSLSKNLPVGFAGPNDHWHYHKNICLKSDNGALDAPLGADRDVDPALCRQIGGSMLTQTNWMLHVWSAPAYSSPQGIFAHNNSALACSDGTYFELPQSQWLAHPLSTCRHQ